MSHTTVWDRLGRHGVALVACALIGAIAFGGAQQVPILGLFDFGTHQLGHLVAMAAPDLIMFLAGSALQIAAPLALALFFGLRRRDPVAVAVALAWAGTAAHDVSRYIADAPFQHLPTVFPGAQHDWAFILGPSGLDAMGSAATLALSVKVSGAALVAGAMAMLVVVAVREQFGLEASPGEIRKKLAIRRPDRRIAVATAHQTPGGSP